MFINMADLSKQLAEDRADLCERGIRLAPSRSSVTRCAMQLAIAGRDQDAKKLTLSVLRAFPADRAAIAEDLRRVTQTFPEIGPLWALSQQQ